MSFLPLSVPREQAELGLRGPCGHPGPVRRARPPPGRLRRLHGGPRLLPRPAGGQPHLQLGRGLPLGGVRPGRAGVPHLRKGRGLFPLQEIALRFS